MYKSTEIIKHTTHTHKMRLAFVFVFIHRESPQVCLWSDVYIYCSFKFLPYSQLQATLVKITCKYRFFVFLFFLQ